MARMVPHFRRALIAVVFLIAGVLVTQAQDISEAVKRWEQFDFAQKRVAKTEVAALPLEDLQLLRGILFGRHGRVFKDLTIKAYLKERPWYQANPDFRNSMLNEVERQNLDLIRDAEASKHDFVQPGDMRYWRTRALTRKKLGQHSTAEWLVLRSEIEAVHGKRFDDQPWLQQYFEERYWYRPSDRYDSQQLSQVERNNLQALIAATSRQRKLALSPGDMELFENKLISEPMLKGLSLHELRLLRNEIYARHGRVFRASWLQQYFWSQPWYEQKEDFKDEEVSGSDKLNVETIVKYENRIHDELGTKPITRSLLTGLFVEDAEKMRQEIYARRGKVFKEPWLQKYFSSFDWYKPNPEFSESTLSVIEKQNLASLLAYEKKAASVLDAVEG
ncbi:MAG: YARHG domain-containing protein [Acidobacteriota bacterium]